MKLTPAQRALERDLKRRVPEWDSLPQYVPFEKYEALVHELLALKRDGFAPLAPVGEPTTPVALPTVVQSAITELGVDAATQRQLTKTAWEMLGGGASEDDVAKKITDGEPVEL